MKSKYKIEKNFKHKQGENPPQEFYAVYERSSDYEKDLFWFFLNWGLTIVTFGFYLFFYLLFYSFFTGGFFSDAASKFTRPSGEWESIFFADTLEDAIEFVEKLKAEDAEKEDTEVYYF